MHWQYTPYIWPLVLGAVVSAALACHTWRRRRATGARAFAALMLAVAEWSAAYALLIAGTDLPTKTLWSKIEYPGIVLTPLAWLVFACQYTGRACWLTRPRLALLATIPLTTVLLEWTNETHGLMASRRELNTTGPFVAWDLTYGGWFWIHAAYSYTLLAIGTALIVGSLVQSVPLYRRQSFALLVAVLTPWLVNASFIFGLRLIPRLDLTPVAFTVTGLAVAWGLLQGRFLDLVPVARDAIFAGLSDGVLVLDAQGRIVDLNPAAAEVLGTVAAAVVGQPAAQVFAAQPDLVATYRDVLEARAEVALGDGVARRVYDLRISPLRPARDTAAGRLIVFRDITQRKQAEEERVQLIREQTARAGAEAAQRRAAFLAEASQQLINALDSETIVLRVAQLAVPILGDACSVHLTDANDQAFARASARPTNDAGHERVQVPGGQPIRSVLVVPLRLHGRAVGTIQFASSQQDQYSAADSALAEDFARRIAVALESARLHRELAEREARLEDLVGRLLVAQEEERRRVAYEVHDGLAQFASGAHQHLEAFTRHYRPRRPAARHELDQARLLTQRAVREARRVIAGLRPTALDDFGLATALRLEVEALRGEGWLISYDETLGVERLPSAIETAFFRVAQEALTNVGKHAGTTEAQVLLHRCGSTIRLEVRDGGRGFEPSVVAESGPGERIGLAGMRERITLLGGRWQVRSRPGMGTHIVAEVPVPSAHR